MGSSSDAVNLSFGILGVLTIVPILVTFIYNRLPFAQLRYFDELISETEAFLLSLEEQAVFRKPSTATHFQTRLHRVREEAELPRMKTYCSTSLWQQLKGLVNGLSMKLSDLSSTALKLRAEISTTASEDMALSRASNDVSTSSSQTEDAYESEDDRTSSSQDVRSSSPSPVTFLPLLCTPLSDPTSLSIPTTIDTGRSMASSPSSHVHHLGDTTPISSVPSLKKRHQSQQYIRRNKRYLASRNLASVSVTQMEHRKSGVMRNDDFKRALRVRTYDSVLSGSTCVSESNSLPVHVKPKPTGDHRHPGLRRVLGFLRHRSRDEASDTRPSYRVAHWIGGLVPTASTSD